MTGAENHRLPASPVVVVVVVVVCISFVVLTENRPSAVFSVMLASYLPSFQMLKPSPNQVAQDCRGLSKGSWGFEGGVEGGDSPPLTLTNHGPCFFCLLFLFFPLPPFFPCLVCLCRAGFSQLCSPRRAFSEQGPLRLIKSASFFSGWRCQLHALCVRIYVCARVCVRVCVGGGSGSSSSAGSPCLECNNILV